MFSILSTCQLKKTINIGSVFEYNQINPNEKKISDNSKYPLTLYGISKLTQTCLANHFSEFESLPITTLRLFTPYGMFEHNGRLISDIMLSSIKNKKLKIMSPHASRDFIFIADVIDGLISASKNSKVIGKIMDIGSGRSMTVNEIIDISKNFLNLNVELINGQNSSHNYDQFSGEVSANISQTKKLLNWKPNTSILEGLKITYSWYKKNISYYD